MWTVRRLFIDVSPGDVARVIGGLLQLFRYQRHAEVHAAILGGRMVGRVDMYGQAARKERRSRGATVPVLVVGLELFDWIHRRRRNPLTT